MNWPERPLTVSGLGPKNWAGADAANKPQQAIIPAAPVRPGARRIIYDGFGLVFGLDSGLTAVLVSAPGLLSATDGVVAGRSFLAACLYCSLR